MNKEAEEARMKSDINVALQISLDEMNRHLGPATISTLLRSAEAIYKAGATHERQLAEAEIKEAFYEGWERKEQWYTIYEAWNDYLASKLSKGSE